MKRAILVVGVLALLACSAQAQTLITANIPFDFVAAGTTLPAGTYEFKATDDLLNMQVHNLQTGKAVVVPVLTRLGNGATGVTTVTFDKVGDTRILETISPATEDGYLLVMTKEKHTHQIVKAS